MNDALYRKQLERAAQRLESLPRADGGWGLTPTSVSSIVNTAEVAVVLRAAGRTGDIARRAVEYLSVAIPTYCRPEPTYPGEHFGRGERTRFVSFGLEGLTTYPEYAFEAGGPIDAINFSLQFLEETQREGGWPETRGGSPDSIHQTSRVVCSLVRLLLADAELGGLSEHQRKRVRQMLDDGAARLVGLQHSDGSWPVRPTSRDTASPTKTALATMALGYLAHLDDRSSIDHCRQDGGRWLIANLNTWDGRTEEDTDEQGTHWVHLAYAECVRGVLAGFPQQQPPQQLKAIFDRLARGWSDTEALWTEPGKPEGKATIRAAYHTVMAFESARADTALVVPKPLPKPAEPILGDLQKIRFLDDGLILIGSRSHAEVSVTTGPLRTLRALADRAGRATTEELAHLTSKRPASIHQDIKLINERAAVASYQSVPRLVRSQRQGSTYYYILAAPVS